MDHQSAAAYVIVAVVVSYRFNIPLYYILIK